MAVAVGSMGIILSAWYLLSLNTRVFLGPLRHEEQRSMKDLSLRETIVLAPLLALMLYVGVKPNTFLAPMEKSLQMSVLAKLTPPPEVMDFAAQEKRLLDRRIHTPAERSKP